MGHADKTGLGAGVYATSEVARMAHIQTQRVRRWVYGYQLGQRRAAPLVQRTAERSLSFLDLLEVCFVKAFLDHGVTMHTIRLVQTDAAKEFKTSHPFCTKRFETDGETIIARHTDETAGVRLLDLKRRQWLIREVFNPLLKQIDYDKASLDAERWWPMGKARPVVIDPQRGFGAALVSRSRVPTRALYAAHRGGQSPKEIADWYEVELDEVRAAIEFEKSIDRQLAS